MTGLWFSGSKRAARATSGSGRLRFVVFRSIYQAIGVRARTPHQHVSGKSTSLSEYDDKWMSLPSALNLREVCTHVRFDFVLFSVGAVAESALPAKRAPQKRAAMKPHYLKEMERDSYQ